MKKDWKRRWVEEEPSKSLWYRTIAGEPDHKLWYAPFKMSRSEIKTISRLRTGHALLRDRMYTMKIVDYPKCQQCDDVEDTYHFVLRCKQYRNIRQEIIEGELQIKDIADLIQVLSSPSLKAIKEMHKYVIKTKNRI